MRPIIGDVEPVASPSPSEAMFKRRLPLLVLSDVSVLVFVLVAGFSLPDHWNGEYLVWGIGVGLLGAANQQIQVYVLPRLVGATKEQAARVYGRGTLRKKIVMVNSVVLGIASGAFSAILDNVIPVLFFTVIVVVSGMAPYLFAPVVASRVRKRRVS
jgi:hypothetical protein